MAISYPLALPNTTSFQSVSFRTRSNVAVTQSPFTFKQQVFKLQGWAWEVDVKLKPMTRDEAEEWNSFFLKLNGQFGTFLMGDPLGSSPRGAAPSGDSLAVDGDDQTGSTLNINGATASTQGYFKSGDYIQIGSGASSKLYKVLDDADSDASGNIELTIYPEIKVAYTDTTAIQYQNTKGLFRLNSNEVKWDMDKAQIYGLSFGAVEAI